MALLDSGGPNDVGRMIKVQGQWGLGKVKDAKDDAKDE